MTVQGARPKTTGAFGKSNSKDYQTKGYCLVRNAIPAGVIDQLLTNYLSLVHYITGQRFSGAHGVDLVAYYNANPAVESEIYGKIRETPWLLEFAQQQAITDPIKQLLGEECALFSKIPFRIDMPQWTHELALWHQDHFYVRGNTDTITAWIPFQTTTYLNGCLSIMPGSHLLGPVPHDVQVGKKHVPSSIFNNEIRMVEMNKGDVLFFNALTLHTGNLNLSPSIRYSLQPRYSPSSGEVDPAMGEVIAL